MDEFGHLKIFNPDHIFKVKCMKLGMEVLFNGLIDECAFIGKIKKFRILTIFCILFWIAFSIDDLNMMTQMHGSRT